VLIVAMFCAIGGHWLVLQTVAWGGMVVEYSRAGGLTAAVEKTFDGRHPCDMCKTIAKTRQSEKKQEARVVVTKLDVFHQPAVEWFAPVAAWWEQPVVDSASGLRAEPPSVPPPRNA
jgi:hypothetical protein